MSLQDAMAAVNKGLAFSTSLGPRTAGAPGPSRQEDTGGVPVPVIGAGGSGEATGTWSLVEGSDGVVYERNSTTGEVRPAPPQFQKQEPQINYEVPAVPMAAANELLADAGYPSGAGLDDAGRNLSDVYAGGAARQMQAALYSPEGARALGVDPNTLSTVKSLMDAGLLTPSAAQKLLFGDDLGGGGGGITAYQAAQMARQAEQDKWGQMLDYITASANERQLQASMQAARRNALIEAAPYLAGGQEWSGGFGPYGGGTLMEMMQGGPGAARPMAPRIVPLDMGDAPVDPGLVDQLLGPAALGV